LTLTLTLTQRTRVRSFITPTLSVEFSRANAVQNCGVCNLWHTFPVSTDRVNYQDLIFQTLIHTTIISGVDDVIWEVVVWISKINAIESLTTVISNKDLPMALTCTKGVVCI